jgi:hypothetical protein
MKGALVKITAGSPAQIRPSDMQPSPATSEEPSQSDPGLSLTSPKPIQPEVKYIEWFFEYAYSYLPVFHSPTFVDQIINSDTSAIYAMSALGLRFHLIQDRTFQGDFSQPNALYKEAKRLAEMQFSNPKLATLQTLILLETYANRKSFSLKL